jgi:hypothetical protein
MSRILRTDLNEQVTAFEKLYSGQDVAPEEYLTELAALLSQGGETVEYKPSTLRKVAALINEFVSRITKGKFQPFKSEVDFKNFVDFLNQISGAISAGGEIDLETKESGDAIISGVVPLAKLKNKSDLGFKKFDVEWMVDAKSGINLSVPTERKELYNVVEKSGGAVVVINSDATGIGLTKDNDLLQGGIGYTFISENVNENMAFAASNDGKIASFYAAVVDAANKRDAEYPEMKGKPVAVFVMVQTPAAMFGNAYSSDYFGRVLKNITTNKLFSTTEAKKELIEFIEDYKANNKTGKKYENSLNLLSDLIKTTDFSKEESIKKLTDLLISNRTSKEDKSAKFGFDIRRSFFEKFFVGVGTVKEGAPARKLRLKLKEQGYNHEGFFKEFGDTNVMSLLEGKTPGKKLGDGNFTLTGFFVDPYQNKKTYTENSKKGTYKHKQFNSKFYGVDPFVLVGKYYVDKMFPEARFISKKTGEEVPVQVAAAGSLYPRTQRSAKDIVERARTMQKDAASAINEYNEAPPAKKQNLKSKAQVAVSEETGFVPVSFWVEQLKGNVGYLDDVVKHILDARQELKEGKVTEDKVVKSYLITLASMGSGGGWYSSWKDKTKQTISDIFLEKKNGRDWIRPEGAGAAYLVTPEGKKLVKDIIAGNATQEQVKDLFSYVGFGRENSKSEYVVKTMSRGDIKAMTDLFNKNKGRDFAELYQGAMKLEGIGEGKTGFFNQYFGVSERGVIDARELNAWVAGSMKLTPEQKEKVKKAASSKKLGDQLLGYIEQVGIELGYPKDLAGYIAHHAIWDGIASSVTTHAGEYSVVSKSQKAQNDKIKEYIEGQRKAGQSDKDIRAGLELVADKVGLTPEDINNLMGVESDEAKPLKGFKPKDKAAKEAEDEQGTEEIINSDNTLQSVPKLEAPIPPTQNEFDETKKAFEEANEVLPDITEETNSEGIKSRVKSIIDAFINNSDEFDTRTKQELNDRLGRFYDVLTFDKLEQIGNEFIEQLGGIDKAVLVASDGTKDIPPFVRTFVLGQAILNAKKEYKNAKTEAEKNKRLDDQIRYSDLLDTTSRAYGQANAYIARFYELDPIAVVRKIKRKVQERNELVEPTAKKKAAEIKKLIEEEGDFTEAINEAISEALEGTQATTDGLQKEIDNLRKEIAKKSGKKYKRYPVNLGVTKDQVIAARKRIFGSAYSNPFLSPEFWKDALILAADAIQEGAVKINDFYDYMNITLKGKYSEAYGEIYQRAKGLAIEKGANESDFSTDEEVQEELDRISKESDAEKITKLTALRAKVAAKREENASKILADKIIKDANKELDNATTQKEKNAISKIIEVLSKKAKEATTASNKPKSQSLSDLITFVLSQAKNGQEIWGQAQKEVFESIDNDDSLSDDKKAELKDFLDNYRKTIFDVLFTRGQKDKIIKEKLIDLGYAKQVGGKLVFNVESIIAGTKSTQEAIDALISKISQETGISEQDLSDLKQAFKTRLDDIIVEKKKAKIDAYLKQKERYRAARLINNRTRKTRVQKLIELYNAGGLTNDAVRNELAEELGIVSFTAEDEAFLNKKLQEADDAPSGAEREKIEEEIQAYLEVKDADFWLKEVSERWRARLLSGFLTAIKNLGGFYDTATMLLQQTIFTNIQSLAKQGTLDKNVLKVVRDARKAALYTAADIFLNGGVDMGNAFSEITNTKEGTPRVRYIEYWKPFFNPTSWKNPIKLRNKLKESEKFIGRTLSFFDTINQVLLQETKTYTYLKDMYIRSGYSAKDASQKAYDAMNSISIIEATNQATNEFDKRGIAIDMTKKADKARFNRRVYEIVQQSREKEATKAGFKFANRYTYKSYDTGIMQPVAATLSSLKNLFPRFADAIRKNAKDFGINYKVADTVAKSIEFAGDDIFMVYLPFIKGVANILEKGLELNPYYGLTKATAYLGVGAGASKDFKQEYYQRSGEYLFRAIMGLAITSLLLSLADDDDEENKKLFGAGQEDYRKQAASKVLRPANTIVIGGRRINLDYLGSYGISLKIEAAFADLKRYDDEYNKLEGSDKYQAQIMAALSTILYSGYTQAIYEAIAPNKEKRKIEQELKMKGSELLTRATIPFTNTSRQLYGMIDPEAKKPISMAEYIAKYSGVVAGWTLDRKNFDYRGRTFNTGQVYSSSPDAFIAMFKETAALADEVDEFIQKGTKGDFSFTTIRKRDEKYFIMDKETNKMREMTDYEYYDVSLVANKKFDKGVTDFYNKYKNNNYKSDSERRYYKAVAADPVLLKKAITYINSSAKKEAFYETFGYVPGTIEQDLINNKID